MASADMNVPMSDVMKQCTVNVRLTGVRVWRVRLWIGCKLIKLASLVMGCGIRMDVPDC